MERALNLFYPVLQSVTPADLIINIKIIGLTHLRYKIEYNKHYGLNLYFR